MIICPKCETPSYSMEFDGMCLAAGCGHELIPVRAQHDLAWRFWRCHFSEADAWDMLNEDEQNDPDGVDSLATWEYNRRVEMTRAARNEYIKASVHDRVMLQAQRSLHARILFDRDLALHIDSPDYDTHENS